MFPVRQLSTTSKFLLIRCGVGGCGSFYAITITSEAFKGLPIVKQHKLVTETLKQEIAGIHGLQVRLIDFHFYNVFFIPGLLID